MQDTREDTFGSAYPQNRNFCFFFNNERAPLSGGTQLLVAQTVRILAFGPFAGHP